MGEETWNPISRKVFDRLTTDLMEHDEKCRLTKMSDTQIIAERMLLLTSAMGYAIGELEAKIEKLIELGGYDIE